MLCALCALVAVRLRVMLLCCVIWLTLMHRDVIHYAAALLCMTDVMAALMVSAGVVVFQPMRSTHCLTPHTDRRSALKEGIAPVRFHTLPRPEGISHQRKINEIVPIRMSHIEKAV